MDTSLISNIYMQRPSEIATQRLGQWFCNATGIQDPDLFYAEVKKSKELILERKYNNLPDLINKLKSYNRSI